MADLASAKMTPRGGKRLNPIDSMQVSGTVEQAAEKVQISGEELKNRMAAAEAQIDIAEFSGPAEAVPLLQGVSRRVFPQAVKPCSDTKLNIVPTGLGGLDWNRVPTLKARG